PAPWVVMTMRPALTRSAASVMQAPGVPSSTCASTATPHFLARLCACSLTYCTARARSASSAASMSCVKTPSAVAPTMASGTWARTRCTVPPARRAMSIAMGRARSARVEPSSGTRIVRSMVASGPRGEWPRTRAPGRCPMLPFYTGARAEALPRTSVSEIVTKPRPLPFRIQQRVRWSECGPLGIIWYGSYLKYFEAAEHEMMRAANLPFETLRLDRGVQIPRKAFQVEFHSPAQMDELLDVECGIAKIGNTSLTLRFEVYRASDRAHR